MSSEKVLVIGDVQDWLDRGRELPTDELLVFKEFVDVSPNALRDLSPSVILSPLMARKFDALDVAILLEDAGYDGPFRVLAPKLPQPEVVRSELRALAPSVDSDLVTISKPPELALV